MLVRRAFGMPHVPELDPFLLLDEFRSELPEDYLPGFPFHPHRGIETITYVLHGRVEHQDSLGNRGTIEEGDVQWMTAGSGIVHQEMPKGDERGNLQGYQLWLNLPASDKMMDPRYREVKAKDIPTVKQNGGTMIKVIAGTVGEVKGPVRDIVTDPRFLDVVVPHEAIFSIEVVSEHTVVAYVMEGSAFFDEKRAPFIYEVQGGSYYEFAKEPLIAAGHAVLYNDGEKVQVHAGPEGVHFLFMSGKPLLEPVAWRGPVVMNSEEELQAAFEEYRKGIFVRYRK
ncbi:MAG: pirin family protein [Methanomicrobiales archaeon]|nr:pirin family protein [Methanomicrobiales archaeon]